MLLRMGPLLAERSMVQVHHGLSPASSRSIPAGKRYRVVPHLKPIESDIADREHESQKRLRKATLMVVSRAALRRCVERWSSGAETGGRKQRLV